MPKHDDDPADREDMRWSIPPGLTPEQRLDWEQARTTDELARAVWALVDRIAALERLFEKTIAPVVEAATSWSVLKRQIVDTVWNSGFGSFRTGPALVAICVIVGLAIVTERSGLDPYRLSGEARAWWNGSGCEDSPPERTLPVPSPE